ncbi:hypothetical protein [Micromonospora marina]|uniref:hypothetical protein n=1 Tax=Micromonospora marina TaxID=307120 RepID=UPI00366AB0DA
MPLPDLPDANGLVTGDEGNWQGSGGEADGPAAPDGTLAGGPGLGAQPVGTPPPDMSTLPPGASNSPTDVSPPYTGMAPPFAGMPGLPGPAGTPGGGGPSMPETPDAQGLIGADPGNWHPAGTGVDLPGAPAGAGPGGPGLTGPGVPVPADAAVDVPAADVHEPGMPEWPGVPGVSVPAQPAGPASGGAAVPERPVASGLVGADGADWLPAGGPQPGEPHSGEPIARSGTPTGGVGLVAPAEPAQPPPAVAVAGLAAAASLAAAATAPAGSGPNRNAPAVPGTNPGTPVRAVSPPTPPVARETAVPVEHRGPVVGPISQSEDDREDPDRPESAELLTEQAATWATEDPDADAPTGDEFVPVILPDDEQTDTTGWDDAGASWLDGGTGEVDRKANDD